MYMAQRQKWQGAEKSEGTVFWKKAVALLIPVGLVIFPVVVHNVRYDRSIVDGEPQPVGLKQLASTGFLPIATNLGINFYLGNHLELREVNNINHPEHFLYFHRIMDEPGWQGVEGAFGQSRYLVRQTLRHIFEKPGDFIRLTGIKVFELFNGVEIPRNANLYAFRKYSVVLSILLWKRIIAFPSGLIIPLGLVGICLSLNLWRKHLLLLGLIAVQFIFIVVFFVTARYRLSVIPLLAIYAAYALESFFCFATGCVKRRAVVPAVLLVVLVLLCNSFTPKIETDHGYSEHGNLGNALLNEDRVDEAIFHYKEALKLAPNYSEANVRLANALSKTGEIDQAIIHYKRALEHMTDCYEVRYSSLVRQHRTACYEVHRYLADVFHKQGTEDEAIGHYVESLRLNPEQPKAHYNLANVLMEEGRLTEAVMHYNEALELQPDYLEAQSNLAKALAKQGRLREAIELWEQLVQINPAESVLHSNLGSAYHRLGQFDKAIMHWNQVMLLEPNHISVLNKLAWLLATCEDAKYRDPIRAVELAQRGCRLTAYRVPNLLDSLAAAYARTGRFGQAVGTAERALEVARLSGAKQLEAEIAKRLQMYRQNQAYHE
jgi:tetratricopeptide (TPR) repeat protein